MMRITEKEKEVKKIEFAELSIGQVFKYYLPYREEFVVLMKIGDWEEEENAIMLTNAQLLCLSDYDICIPVEAELIVYS